MKGSILIAVTHQYLPHTRGLCVYLEAASQLASVQAKSRKFPDERWEKKNNEMPLIIVQYSWNQILFRQSYCTLLEVFTSGMSLSDRSLFSISSQFRSLSLNNILDENIQQNAHSLFIRLSKGSFLHSSFVL